MKRQGEGRDGGQLVTFQAACEGVDVREIAGSCGLGPGREPGLVREIWPEIWPEQDGEGADEPGKAGHLGARGGQLAEQRPLAVAEGVRPGEQQPG